MRVSARKPIIQRHQSWRFRSGIGTHLAITISMMATTILLLFEPLSQCRFEVFARGLLDRKLHPFAPLYRRSQCPRTAKMHFGIGKAAPHRSELGGYHLAFYRVGTVAAKARRKCYQPVQSGSIAKVLNQMLLFLDDALDLSTAVRPRCQNMP